MFVTREEREPLGGVFSYWLPVSAAGALVLFAAASVFFPEATPTSSDQRVGIVFWAAGAAVAATLFFLGGKGRWRKSLIAALTIGSLCGTWVWLGHVMLAGLVWLPAVALAAGIVDQRGKTSSLWPDWPIVFARLVAIPVTVLMFAFIAALVTIPALAIMDIGDIEMQEAAGIGIVLVAGGLAVAGLLAAFVRRQRVLIGAVRYALIWAAQFVLPVALVISLVLIGNVALSPTGTGPFGMAALGWLPLVIAVSALLIYQTGHMRAPGLFLRLMMSLTPFILGALLYCSYWVVADQGAGPIGAGTLSLSTLVLIALCVFLLAGVLSQPFFRKQWMAPLAPLLVVLTGLCAVLPLVVSAVGVLAS
ncbi:hypothetical protein [Aquisalinus flavus]|uniref:Uncharacterized protein n=1 Tax=Aquisalinus flavus TaxID=1526572 RepID=A0A8J2V1J9_9PROT|nr:hypothetical protein [Aquisalinus flavus]MBD0426397.1 hypothetical protein [Aquisalinus flavus]UNE48044.1 hypothetical protein FF099_08280 [Aquisalinus flavus]GGD08277.1 hypothetical protein GCM10011342_16390 [Aquisalinus flavus]